ncbi:MAG: PAS domain S-box protein [Spirochaetes bacterium]|nr:PAS domain S-box protein [Spirochaetota bacterium]
MDKKKLKPKTPRKKGTAKRKASNRGTTRADDAAMYRSVIEMFPDALMLNSMDGIIKIATNQAAKLHGYNRAEDMIGLNVFKTISPEENSKIDASFKQLLATGSVTVEHSIIRKDGNRIPVEIRLALLRDSEGKPAGIVSTSHDISERKQAETALKESEDRYRRITGAVTDYVYSVRIEQGMPAETIHGPACEAVTGYTSDEFSRDPYLWINMVHEDDREAVRNMAERLLSGAGVEAIEHRIWRKDGSLRWVRNTPVPHYNADGRLTSYDGLISDITERKIAETALKEREERYRIITELSTDYVFKISIGENGTLSVDYISENLLKMTGRTQDDVSTSDLWEGIIYPDDAEAFVKFQTDVIKNGRAGEIECRSFRKDGIMRWIRIYSQPILDAAGRRVVSVIGAIKDIDERKKAEEAMSDIKRQLEFIIGVTKTGIDIVDSDFNLVYIDPEWMKLYGEPAGRKCYDYFMGRNEKCPGCGIPTALETKKITITEEVLVKEDNRVIEVHTIPFQNASGDWQVAEFSIDITERKKSEEALRESEARYRLIMENSPQGMHLYKLEPDGSLVFTGANPSAGHILGVDHSQFVGKTIEEAFPPLAQTEIPARYRKVCTTQTIWHSEQVEYHDNRITGAFFVQAFPIGSDQMVAAFYDITERKKAEEKIKASLLEKETLLKEIHHRVKNNMQIITSLLNLQARNLSDQELLKQFADAQSRIRSMALVHEKLYQSNDLGRIGLRSYIKELSDEIMGSYASGADSIKLTIDADETHLPIDRAIPFGLIINELLTNAIKYAFPPGWERKKEILIRYRELPEGTAVLAVSDSGRGMPEGVVMGKTETLGLMLVPMLAQQLNGTITIERSGGTTITISFSKKR